MIRTTTATKATTATTRLQLLQGALAVLWLGSFAGGAWAQPPQSQPTGDKKPAADNKPSIPPTPRPATPPADSKPSESKPATTETKSRSNTPFEQLQTSLAVSKTVLARTRDYAGYLVRQETVAGKLTPEQLLEIRVRRQPMAIYTKMIQPLALAGEETVWNMTESRLTVRFRPAGVAGVRGAQVFDLNDPKVLANTSHPLSQVGLDALVERMEKMLAIEQQVQSQVPVYVGDYQYGKQSVLRFEIIADRPHPARYAAKCVLFVERQTQLPVRFEAYNAGRSPGQTGQLLETQSYLDLKLNVGLGESHFKPQ